MGRREREKLQKSVEILQAAERLFSEHGFNKVSMEEVAKEAEFSKRTLYQYFSSKDELIAALVIRSFQAFKTFIDKELRGLHTGLEKLIAVGEAHLTFRKNNLYHYGAISYSFTDIQEKLEAGPYVQRCRRWMNSTYVMLAGLIRQGQRDGSIKKGINARKTSLALVAVLNGLLAMEKSSDVRNFLPQSWQDYDEIALFILGMIRDSISTKPYDGPFKGIVNFTQNFDPRNLGFYFGSKQSHAEKQIDEQ